MMSDSREGAVSELTSVDPVPAIADFHSRVDDLERAMLNAPELLIDMPVRHRFTDGLYIREIFNPAGTLIATKIHKTEHPFALLIGRISVLTADGSIEHIEAPHVGITAAGTRRVIFAHTDSVFVTFHANPDNERDIAKLEARAIEWRELEDGKSGNQLFLEALRKRAIADGSVVS